MIYLLVFLLGFIFHAALRGATYAFDRSFKQPSLAYGQVWSLAPLDVTIVKEPNANAVLVEFANKTRLWVPKTLLTDFGVCTLDPEEATGSMGAPG